MGSLFGHLAATALLLAGPPPTAAAGFTVERAEDWEALFLRTSGWTGADGIYSFPLSGVETPGAGAAGATLFVFSDTFIGEIGPDGQREPGWALVNNTLAAIPAGPPDPARARFLWGRDEEGEPAAVFVPQTPESTPGDWYWPMDGVTAGDGVLRILAMRMRAENGGFGFAVDGVALLTVDLAAPGSVLQADAPLFRPAAGERGDVVFGAAVTPNTAAAGAPDPDGYVYVYGVRSDFLNKKLLAARVPAGRFEDFTEWRFFDGAAWVEDLDDAAPLTDRISQELSVSPLPDGRFVAVFQLDALGRQVAARLGASPVGPFAEPVVLWDCPEPGLDPDVYVYNAKAHPHLGAPGELLVSYNVNSFEFGDHLRHGDLYRPRFFRVRFR